MKDNCDYCSKPFGMNATVHFGLHMVKGKVFICHSCYTDLINTDQGGKITDIGRDG